MPKSTTTTVSYQSMLLRGVREANPEGVIYADGEIDEPFAIQVRKITRVTVRDGRGVDHSASGYTSDVVAELSLEQAGSLLAGLAGDLAYAAVVGEHRALTEEARR